MFQDKKVEEWVPPLQLCSQIQSVPDRERVAAYLNDSLFVWAYYWAPGMGSPEWTLMRRESSEFTDMPIHPAPLLEEVMEVLLGDLGCPPVELNMYWMETGALFALSREDDTAASLDEALWEERDKIASAAALRMLLRLKGVKEVYRGV